MGGGVSLVYYQAEGTASVTTAVNCMQGKETWSWVRSFEKSVKELRAASNSLKVETKCPRWADTH